MVGRWVIVWLAMAGTGGGPPGSQVTAELSSATALVGERVTMSVRVRDAEQVSAPRIPEADGLSITLLSPTPMRTSSTHVINNRVTSWVEYTWALGVTPLKAGRLTVPAMTVVADGEAYQTRPLTLLATRGESGDLLIVEVEVSRREAYVEQAVSATLRVWIRPYRQQGTTLSGETMWQLVSRGSSDFGMFEAPKFVGMRERSAARRGETGKGKEGEGLYYLYETTGEIWPERPGVMRVGDVRIVMDYPEFISQDLFGRLTLGRKRTLTAIGGEATVRVRSLPEEGRPETFNGAVGRYSIEASAKPTEAHVGDPITLTLVVRGEGRLERVSAPPLTMVEPLMRDFRVPDEALAGRIEGSAKVFTQTIRARHSEVREVPPIPMSFFDPEAGRYETVWTAAVPLRVRESERLPLSRVVEAEPRAMTVTGGRPVPREMDGLLANYVAMEQVLSDQRLRIGWGWAAVMVGCPLAYVGAWLVQRRSARFREDSGYRRRIQAAAAARRLLRESRREAESAKGGPMASEGPRPPRRAAQARVGEAVRGYVADRLNVAAGGLTRVEVRRLLEDRGVSLEVVEEVDSLLGDVELAAYAGAGVSSSELAERAERVLTRLERNGL